MWKFPELSLGVPERDPHEAEFFHLTEPAEAVVREVIQNSLDAKVRDKIKVCFTFGKIEADKVKDYLNGLEPHLKACDYSTIDGAEISHLTIEDFGTSGLDGPTLDDGNRPEGKSNFYSFWWCEGKSRKTGSAAGRWGLGKTTFHLASRIRSFWGYTLRNDDSRELLMGKALLKTHRLRSTVFQYSGYYAKDGFKAINDRRIIEDFKKKFAIARSNESGLSLVIPLPDPEINLESIKRSVIIHYFFAIMKGILNVEIKNDCQKIELNEGNLVQSVVTSDWHGTPWEGVNVKDVMDFIQTSINTTQHCELTLIGSSMDITSDSFGEKFNALRESFNQGNFMAFRIPIRIRKVNDQPSESYFEIFLKKCPELKQADEFYIRSGIMISGIKMMTGRPVRGLFLAEDKPITMFLGDSETPAHTEWNERTEGFKEKYVDAVKTLKAIKRAMIKIVSILDQPPTERQKDFLKDVFFIKERIENEGEDDTPTRTVTVIPKKPPVFEINRINGGLRITLSKPDEVQIPIKAVLVLAYDVRRGSPFKQYEINDFDLSGNSGNIESKGCTVTSVAGNKMTFEVQDKDFNLEITGFDTNRDLVIKLRED